MAGSISLSLTQQFDELGRPLSDGRLYIYAAETTTPQNAYQDYELTELHDWPIELDSAGRLPLMYFADGFIGLRLADRYDVTQQAEEKVLVVGPSTTTGGGGTVDPATLLQTGWVQPIYGTGVRAGFVRLNGRTIGNATSGAAELASADAQALYIFLYNEDPNLTVSLGRSGDALADFNAGKLLALPDFRGRGVVGLDDMGSSPAGRITATYYGSDPTILGAGSNFLQYRTLSTTHLPPYTPAGSVTAVAATGTISQITPAGTITNGAITISGGTLGAISNTTAVSAAGHAFADVGPAIAATQATSSFAGTPVTPAFTGTGGTATFNGTAQGGLSTAFSIISPSIVLTFYIKL